MSKMQRNKQHAWSFRQLRAFVVYKAQRAGMPVLFVDPRHTSRPCSRCGYVEKKNRRRDTPLPLKWRGFVGFSHGGSPSYRPLSRPAGFCRLSQSSTSTASPPDISSMLSDTEPVRDCVND